MIRRPRISVRPNVKPPARALTGSHDASLDKTQPNQTPTDSGPSPVSEVIAEQVNSDPPATESEKTSEKAALSSNYGNDVDANRHEEDAASKSTDSQAATSTSLTSGPQRRKRFTALPNLAKPRVSPVSSNTPKSPSKSPVKPVTPNESEKPAAVVESALGAPLVKEPVANPKVPVRQRPSVGGRRPKAQPTPTVPPQIVLEKGSLGGRASDQQQPLETSQPDPVIPRETPPECPIPAALDCKVVEPENNSGLDLEKDQYDPLRKKLKSGSKVIKTLKDPADMIRLAKARKLRELLKMEMSKSKEDKKKPRMGVKERKVRKDHNKMTMRELIYYLPASNPMKSFTEEEEKASEIVLPNSPKPTSSKPSTGPSVQENEGEDDLREDEEEAEADMAEETHAEDPLMVPRVKVAEDGSLIIDEESLTVQVSRMNGPNPAEDRDPIFERGSTTTYSSFKKGTYTKPWSNGETDLFYLAISMVGTDFSMIGQLFPHRARVEIKNKFKKEERINSWRIDKAFKEKRRLDLDFFKTLMEQILKEEQTKKDKNKELIKLAKAQRTFRKPRVVKRKEIRSSESSDNDEVAGEKENEDLWNEEGADPQDCENQISEGLSSNESRLKESENVSKSPVIKPAQLNGRPQRPTPTLSNRCGNRRPGGEETKKTTKVTPVLVQEREKKQSSILQELEDLEEEPDLTAVQEQIFNKPTRSGRIPKLSQHVMQAATEEEEDEEVLYDPQLSSNNQGFQAPGRRAKVKPGPSLKQGMTRRGKSRLLTLRATGTEDDDDDDDEEDVEECDVSSNVEEENQAFVPMSLRSLPPDNSEVLETVEELDISLNVPDILGTSQNALCPEFSCEQAEMPAGSVPCEHQLDLLVDVIEFLDPDHMEVCNEINNEAAQTLLTIGCSAQMIQTTEVSCTGEDYISEQPLSDVHEEVVQEVVFTETVELQADASVVLAGPSVRLESETKAGLNLSSIGSDVPEPASEETHITTEQPIRIQTTNDVAAQDEMQNLSSSTSAPPSRRVRFSKPKPNIGQGLKTRRVQQQQTHQEPDAVQSSSGTNSTELNKNTTEPMQETSGPADYTPQDSSNILAVVMQPDTASERKDGHDNIPEKDSGSNPSLKRKSDDVITEESAKKDRREVNEAEPETEQMKSVSQEERSDESSRPVRRYRGHRPKAKLTSTDSLVQTQQNTTSTTTNETIQTQSAFSKILPEESSPVAEFSTSTFTPIESPEEGAVVTTEAQHEKVAFDTGSDMAVKEVTTQVVSGDELKQKTVAVLEENTRSTSDGNDVGELPVCLLQDTSADPTHDEPVFILSLTEIPPTFDEGMDFETETLGSTTMNELHSQSQSSNERRETSHLLITDALVPVAEEEEKGDGDNTSKGDLEHTAPASRSQRLDKTESQTEHPVFEKTECTEEAKERVEKKKEVPERARRAKLQVKPNTLTRKSTRGAKEETPAHSSIETTSVPISTLYSQETISVLEQNVRASNSTTVKDSLTSAVTSDGEATNPSSSNIPALLKDSRQLANQDSTSEELEQGQVDLAGKDAVELSVTEASGSQSLDVSQIASVPTSGPLTRPGRRPKGFLSFISSKSTQAPSGTYRGSKPGPQKPAVNTSRPDRKRVAAITVTSTKNPEAMQPSTSTSSTSKTENSEEEPTSVSKYFFSDIFTEVDELEDMD